MKPSPQQLIGDVAIVTGVSAPAISGRRKTNAIVFARHLAIAAIRRQYPHLSLTELASFVGRTNHGTAINALRQFQNLSETSPPFRALAAELNLL
jgi:chromosomal replication initiation ATPase DnaA